MLTITLTLLLAAGVQQAPDTAYARMVREATTDERFLPASVATIPLSETVPSPLDHFGVIAGAPGVAHPTAESYGYLRTLAAASPRVAVQTVGSSLGGREMIIVIIADEATMRNLDRVKADLGALADPRRTDQTAAERIIAQAKPVYYVQTGQHAPEMGPPEMILELAYRLAVSEDPAIRRIRENVVTLINPAMEPDGRDRQVEWYYRHTKGRERLDDGFPRSVPYWGDYVYHDNNRDGIQISQNITKASYRTYFEWHPTVMHDLHESVPLLYISIGTGPYNRNVDPILVTEWQTLANWDVQSLTAQGVPGVWTWGYYDGWWRGYQTWIAANHNGIGRFFETYGNSGADTYLRDLRGSRFAGDSVTSTQWYRPWPPTKKVLWSLRNNTNLMQAGVLSSLDYAARNGRELLRNFWQKGANSVRRGLTQAPHGFVIPPFENQRDPRRAAYLVNQVMRHGIEVHRSTDTLPGSFVVLLNQPYRDFAVDLLTRQDYPAEAEFPPPDVAWTLGLIYGVEVQAVDDSTVFAWPGLQLLEDTVAFHAQTTIRTDAGNSGRSTWLMRYAAQAEALPALFALRERERRAQAFAAEAPFSTQDGTWDAGTIILENLSAAGAGWLAHEFGLPLTQTDGVDVPRHPLDLPRIAVYHTWISTQDEGWIRYWLDQLNVPFTSIHKDDLRAGQLKRRFDVIVVPASRGDVSSWIHGIDSKWGPIPYTATAEFPSHGTPSSTPDMTGGPGFAGLGELEKFLDEGGTVIAMGNAVRFVTETGLIRELTPHNAAGLFHPTSVVRAKARRPDHPILYGYPEVMHLLRGNGPLWRTAQRDRHTIVLQYGMQPLPDERDTVLSEIMGMPSREMSTPSASPAVHQPAGSPGGEGSGRYVLSGMVRNSNAIIGHGAIFDVPAGANEVGRVIAFSFNPMHRYLNHHDAPMVFNAILNWNDRVGGDAAVSSGGN
jgi:hypothetical protein